MTDWYVDSTAAPGGDGSITTPWETMAVIDWDGLGGTGGGPVLPGDTVYFAGAFTSVNPSNASVVLQPPTGTDGTAALPITLCGNRLGVRTTINAATMQAGIRLNNREYFDIYGFYIENADDGITTYGQNVDIHRSSYVTVRDCVATNAYWDDFRLQNCVGCVIHNCLSYSAQNRAFLIGGDTVAAQTSTGNVIRNCMAKGAIGTPLAKRGYTISGAAAGANDCTNDVIRDCTCDGADEGLQLENATGCTVDGLRLTTNGEYCLQEIQNLTNCTIKNSYITGGTLDFAKSMATLANFTIQNCELNSAATDGFIFTGICSDVTIKDCIIANHTGAVKYVIDIDGTAAKSNFSIINNYFYNFDLGISVQRDMGGTNEISRNTFGRSGAGDKAIVIRATQTGTFAINDNIFDLTAGPCMQTAGGAVADAGTVTTARNFYTSEGTTLVTWQGTGYLSTGVEGAGSSIRMFESTARYNRSEAVGYNPPGSRDGTVMSTII